jgi:hypothetical protein
MIQKVGFRLSCIAALFSGGVTFLKFFNAVSLQNLIYLLLLRTLLTFIIFRALTWGIEQVVKWKIPQLVEVRGKKVDYLIPPASPEGEVKVSQDEGAEVREGETSGARRD